MELFQSWDDCVVHGVASLRCVPTVFHNIVTAALLFAGLTAVVFIIIAGYKFMTSGGDPKQVEGARKTGTYAVLGLMLILLSFAIVTFIGTTTGVTCINGFTFNNCDTADSNAVSAPVNDQPGSNGGGGGQDNRDNGGNRDGRNNDRRRNNNGGRRNNNNRNNRNNNDRSLTNPQQYAHEHYNNAIDQQWYR